MVRNCLVCSKEFITYPNRIKRGGGKYCSHKCVGLGQRNRIVKNCVICEKQFEVRPSEIRHDTSIYCSHHCADLGKIGRKKPIGSKHPKWKGGITLTQKFCLDCGKKIYYRSDRCQQCAYKMELHHNWNGGSSFLPYPPQFNSELKDKIRQRDDYTCQRCGITSEEHILIYSRELDVHHIDYIKENCNEGNLVTLCNQCNLGVNYNRAYWTEFLTLKIKEKCNEKVS